MKFYVYLYNTQVMKPTLLKTFVINEIIIILGKGKPFNVFKYFAHWAITKINEKYPLSQPINIW